MLSMLDVVGDFLLKEKWRDHLIDSGRKLLAVDEGQLYQVSEQHPGI